MKKLELKFRNEEDKIVTYSLDNPIEPVDPAAVNEAMDEILAQNVFTTSGGELVAKASARVVEQNIEDIEIN
ncbi:DUF2922 domain-containing protein [Ralstonia pickettii]|nr:DUF2922 domain-containing protein [Ralstonia pickettii]